MLYVDSFLEYIQNINDIYLLIILRSTNTMAEKDESQTRLMELQMKALKEEHGVEVEVSSDKNRIPKNARSANNAKIAKLYEDAAEYEEELKCFEEELEVIKTHTLKEIPAALMQKFPEAEGNYEKELKSAVEATWVQHVEVNKTHPKEQLDLIQETDFPHITDALKAAYPDYAGDFEAEMKTSIIQRWEMFITIKDEHIKDERADMKLRGMKPDHIRKVYRNYHGLLD